LKDFGDTVTYLLTSVPDYTNKPRGRLYGLTPNEVLNGNIPVKDNYQQDMIKARKNRLEQNRLIECCEKK
jgi:putative transposase